jgi:hypothetical protein
MSGNECPSWCSKVEPSKLKLIGSNPIGCLKCIINNIYQLYMHLFFLISLLERQGLHAWIDRFITKVL